MSSFAIGRASLAVSILVFGGAGLAFLVAPEPLMGALGADLRSVDATSDVRAFVGGLELGVAGFLVYCALSTARIPTGLAASVFALVGVLLARALSLVADGMPTSSLWVPIGLESGTLALATVALARTRRLRHSSTR